jgi:hypothetical protein
MDPALAGYIVITYRISALDPEVRDPVDTVSLVTRETDPTEIEALVAMCHIDQSNTVPKDLFATLQPNEGALLPGPEEAHGRLRRFTLGPRLTEHVRHRAKYLDMPVGDDLAFIFTGSGGSRARSLKEFIRLLEAQPAARLEDHFRRHDFSRWIDEVFRDHPLAVRLRTLESTAAGRDGASAAAAIGQAIRARYDTAASGSQLLGRGAS